MFCIVQSSENIVNKILAQTGLNQVLIVTKMRKPQKKKKKKTYFSLSRTKHDTIDILIERKKKRK